MDLKRAYSCSNHSDKRTDVTKKGKRHADNEKYSIYEAIMSDIKVLETDTEAGPPKKKRKVGTSSIGGGSTGRERTPDATTVSQRQPHRRVFLPGLEQIKYYCSCGRDYACETTLIFHIGKASRATRQPCETDLMEVVTRASPAKRSISQGDSAKANRKISIRETMSQPVESFIPRMPFINFD